ncbi:MAG TPA: SpoIID/LytB domain-containing protein [Bacteroidia bacterium]|jgi:stage II sporulation protein D|nr:SpoIID/LytB domain-containing protein [Bacteroidia bacterium]
MTRIRTVFIFAFILLIQHAFASAVSVRILTAKVVSSFIFSPLRGDYTLYGDGALLSNCDASGIYEMSIEHDSILLKTFERTIGRFATIKLIARDPDGSFKIKSVIPETKIRTYDDHVSVSLTPDKRQFLLINRVDLEKYIAGVVESEAGTKSEIEYYKLQSILCRTYLLAHLTRHVMEGFEVCDDVHCQAYLSKASRPEISESVFNTMGEIIVDSDLNLITAAFHSNCGGETCNSQDVWAVSTSYLKSVHDTFCLNMPHAHWKRSISLEDWKAYLQLKHNYPVDDSMKFSSANSFNQGNARSIYFMDKNLKIPLKTIRADFQLKSTFFSIEQQGDMVIFNGRGYGHGVGLCQEGAMQMAKLHYNYKDILNFYFKDVYLINLNALSYFKQE